MKTSKQNTGDLGEGIAVLWLQKNGFTVRDRNYRKKWGEIDIIAEKGGKIHFVEVKTVTRRFGQSADYYEAEDNIHPWKLKRLSRAIETYLLSKKLEDYVNFYNPQPDIMVIDPSIDIHSELDFQRALGI